MTGETWRLLKDTTHAERSWPDDTEHYYNECMRCGRMFTGYKRRGVCRACDSAPQPPAQPAGMMTVEAHQRIVAEAVAQAYENAAQMCENAPTLYGFHSAFVCARLIRELAVKEAS